MGWGESICSVKISAVQVLRLNTKEKAICNVNRHCHFSLWEEMDIDKEDISSVMISSLLCLIPCGSFDSAAHEGGDSVTALSHPDSFLTLNKLKLTEAGTGDPGTLGPWGRGIHIITGC